MPVMAAALRPRSYEIAGELSDGAISWMCPLGYLTGLALPALKRGANAASRETPSTTSSGSNGLPTHASNPAPLTSGLTRSVAVAVTSTTGTGSRRGWDRMAAIAHQPS
ncbi:MAG TPA: hypothetical protein PKA89_10755 [Phycicoccus sp.]|nr:hypothetical protein [Phycicoccus sp.]